MQDVPAWCESTTGNGPLLLIAPHGGRRPPFDPAAPPPRLRINDLHTAELTRTLAARLDAAAIVNAVCDRNALDLNRISQVERQAPWFFDLLDRHVTAILARHEQAEIVFVHGWNIGQPRCDLGFGASETTGCLHVPARAGMSVSDTYRTTRVAALQTALREAGIHVTVGAKYPASHPNNMVQVFARRDRPFAHPAARRLAALARADRVHVVQLELGIPLRWPGPWRTRLLDAVTAAYGPPRAPAIAALPSVPVGVPGPGPHLNVHFYDPAADLGAIIGVGPNDAHTLGGRVLLFLGGQRVGLFTGESPAGRGAAVPPLRVESAADRVRVAFQGEMLVMEDAGAYLDLEAAMAASRLVTAEVHLTLGMHGSSHTPRPCVVTGRVTVAGTARRVEAGGFVNGGALRMSGPAAQTLLTAHFGDGDGIWARWGGSATVADARRFSGGAERPSVMRALSVIPDGNAYTPSVVEVWLDGDPVLRAEPVSRMAILRTVGVDGYVRVTFGAARFEWAGRCGWGWYEHAVPLARPDA